MQYCPEAASLREVGHIHIARDVLPAHHFELFNEGQFDLGVFVGRAGHVTLSEN